MWRRLLYIEPAPPTSRIHPIMSLEPTVGSEATADSRHLRIHKWISTLPPTTNLALHHHSSSVARADSPLLGFTSQENASLDPLHQPSPNYTRRLPEGSLPNRTDEDKVTYSMRIYAHVLMQLNAYSPF